MKTKILYSLFLLVALIPMTAYSQNIEIHEVQPGLYIYQSFINHDGGTISANGVIVESAGQVALIDTPWDKAQTIGLLDWIQANIDKPITFTVITHAHLDRIGGIDVMKSRNIPTIANHLTLEEARKNGFTQPDYSFQQDTLLKVGNESLEVFYPGPGHTPDNSVIYLNDSHVVYGGCFIKSSTSTSIGNLEDADVGQWPSSLQRVVERYPHRILVIPGHGYWSNGAIENTFKLLTKIE